MLTSPPHRKGKKPEAPAAAAPSARAQPAVSRPNGGQPAQAPAPAPDSGGGGFFSGLLVGGLAVAAAGALAYTLSAVGAAKSVETDGVDDEGGAGGASGPSGSGDECVVCLSGPKSHAFVPCGHQACCGRCAAAALDGRMQRCPVCRALLDGSLVMRVYK